MIEIKNKQDCCGCEACYNVCPLNCISMKYDKEGFKFPYVDHQKCVDCRKCESACPMIRNKPIDSEIAEGYAAVNKNLNDRLQSSSGGVFGLLATKIINLGGIVVGCSMAQDCKRAEHIVVDTQKDLSKLYGSKYIQSDINRIYSVVKNNLIKQKPVLFSGTPCQVEGLKSFLAQPYDNLICVDLICHGVPSPILWEKNAEYIEKKSGSTLKGVNFRCKNNKGQFEYRVNSPKNTKMYYRSKEEDSYFQFFLKNLSLRRSCYQCRFKGINRSADITLGDFWGGEEFVPSLCDGNGISIVILHSLIGKKLFEEIKVSLDTKKIDIDAVFSRHNRALTESFEEPENRQEFWMDFHRLSYGKLSKKYAPVSKKDKVKALLRKSGLLDLIRKGCLHKRHKDSGTRSF